MFIRSKCTILATSNQSYISQNKKGDGGNTAGAPPRDGDYHYDMRAAHSEGSESAGVKNVSSVLKAAAHLYRAQWDTPNKDFILQGQLAGSGSGACHC